MSECPKDRLYASNHMWVRVNSKENTAELGLSEDAVENLGEFLSIDLPQVEDELEIDINCIFLHLHKKEVEPVTSPLTGRVLQINREVLKNPELLHLEPYEQWLLRMEYDEDEELEMLMQAEDYSAWLDENM